MTRTQALQFTTFAGMPWRKSTPADWVTYNNGHHKNLRHSWTGKELVVSSRRDARDVCHETCHWLIATRDQRRLPEFGLGSPVYNDIWGTETKLEHYLLDVHEVAACILDVYLSYLSGGPWTRTASGYNMDVPVNAGVTTFQAWWVHIQDDRLDRDAEAIVTRRNVLPIVNAYVKKYRLQSSDRRPIGE